MSELKAELHADQLAKIRHTLALQLPYLRQRYGVIKLGIFGSYVRGQDNATSDLDVLVEFDERPLSLLKFIELENHLSDLLGMPVDLVEASTLKPRIGKRVLSQVIPV